MSTFICILHVQLDVDQKHIKKTVPLKNRVWPVIYQGNSTFRPSHFLNTRFSKVDFALYFTGVILCFFPKKTLNSLSKTIPFDSLRFLFSTLGPFGPLVFAWVPQGCLQEPFWPHKAGFTERKQQLLLEAYCFAYIKQMFWLPELLFCCCCCCCCCCCWGCRYFEATELNCTELNWIELNWTELNW